MDYLDSISKRLWQLICYEKMPQKVEDELNRIHDTVNLIDEDITERLEEELSNAHSEVAYWEEECENYTDLIRDNEELEEKIVNIEKHVVQLERDLRQYKKIGKQFSAANKTVKLFRKGLA